MNITEEPKIECNASSADGAERGLFADGGKSCRLCPLECGVDRAERAGVCGVGGISAETLGNRNPYETALIARAARHYCEEPPISGKAGSGAIFFSGCNMGCIFCQNMDISQCAKGEARNAEELAQIMLRLQELGANNINLVTPAPHIRMLIKAIPLAREQGLRIPIVYNTNSYEKVEALRLMEGLVDIYLPDLKYQGTAAAKKYSRRADYFPVAAAAVKEMQRQCGVLRTDERGIAQRGVIVRHLVLPGSVDEARGVLDFIKENLPIETHISLMSQYTPMFELQPPLNRRLLKREYRRAVDYALSLGFENVYIQSLSSASEEFTPEFNGFFE